MTKKVRRGFRVRARAEDREMLLRLVGAHDEWCNVTAECFKVQLDSYCDFEEGYKRLACEEGVEAALLYLVKNEFYNSYPYEELVVAVAGIFAEIEILDEICKTRVHTTLGINAQARKRTTILDRATARSSKWLGVPPSRYYSRSIADREYLLRSIMHEHTELLRAYLTLNR